MSKKGELTTQQIVLLVILIASFAVILFFILKLNLGGETAQDVCHNSVVARGTSAISSSAFPIKCQRQYVCLSTSNSCSVMTKPTIIQVENKTQVYHALAEQLANCWWMFGEGKINYVGSDLSPKNYCSLCSQIAFDPSVYKLFGGQTTFNMKDFYQYLSTTKMSTGQTYEDYFLLNGVLKANFNFGNVDMSKEYYALMGITSSVSNWGWALRIGGGVAVAAGVIAFWPLGAGTVGAIVGGLLVGSVAGTGTYFLAPVVKGSSGNDYIPPSLIQVNSQAFNALNCTSIETSS